MTVAVFMFLARMSRQSTGWKLITPEQPLGTSWTRMTFETEPEGLVGCEVAKVKVAGLFS